MHILYSPQLLKWPQTHLQWCTHSSLTNGGRSGPSPWRIEMAESYDMSPRFNHQLNHPTVHGWNPPPGMLDVWNISVWSPLSLWFDPSTVSFQVIVIENIYISCSGCCFEAYSDHSVINDPLARLFFTACGRFMLLWVPRASDHAARGCFFNLRWVSLADFRCSSNVDVNLDEFEVHVYSVCNIYIYIYYILSWYLGESKNLPF